MSTVGLPVSRLINVTLNLSTAISGFANLNSTLLLGVSPVIDPKVRVMEFGSLAEVQALFGTTAPEARAALHYFAQNPTPSNVFIGRWVNLPSSARVVGFVMTAAQQAMSNFTVVNGNGGFWISVDGNAAVEITGIDFSAATNLNAVASIVTQAMVDASVAAHATWNGQQFNFFANSTGAASKIIAPSAPPLPTVNVAALMHCNLGALPFTSQGADVDPGGVLTAVQLCEEATYWYALNLDACTVAGMQNPTIESVAAYIEADAIPHILCFSTLDPNALDPTSALDIGAILHGLGYQRTFVQWATHTYPACSTIALFMTLNLQGNNTMITAAYKQCPGITPEVLTTQQASALDAKGYIYYAMFNNGVPVIVNGCMICTTIENPNAANEVYIDEMFGADGLANAIQTNFFNLLASLPKLPQTDAGAHLGANAIEQACAQYVTNGYLGPGTWTAQGFGQLATGDFMPKGYYIYTPPTALQAQASRAARQSVPYQVAAKTAGAVHTADIAITVNA